MRGVPLKRKKATKILTDDSATAVVYYGTYVVVFTDKDVRLNSGGWQTVSTKARMNLASDEFNLGFGVYQRKGKWFVDIGNRSVTLDFEDNMIFPRLA